jgi:hypothetical protein
MKEFIIVNMVLYAISSLVVMIHLISATYPRKIESRSVGFDAAILIIDLSIIIWAGIVLWL